MRSNKPSKKHRKTRRTSLFGRKPINWGPSRLSIEALEKRNLMAVAVFQQGLGGYSSQEDTVLYSRLPDVNFGTEGSISPDQQDANGVRQGLMKFGNIFGDGPGQIPIGATINSATLIVDVVNDSNSSMLMSLYRMQQDWSESTATWNSFGTIPGVQASEGEATDLPPDAVLLDADTTVGSPVTGGRFDVTKSLEYWASGAANYGWMFESASTNGWDFRTKENAQSQRPRLEVTYDAPAATADFQILSTSIFQAEGNSGTSTALVEVARLGDVSAAASINYTIVAGGSNPAQAGDFVATVVPQTLNFAPNQAYATIPVTINGDTQLEGQETVVVTLSGGAVVAGRDVATITIADDDALINEVLANVTNNDDETNREYIELIGTPGASLNGYYFVVFEGEEEEGAVGGNGAGAGVADLVIDLTGQTFGANGLLVITGSNWEYQGLKDAATNQMIVPAFDAAGGLLEDSSQTYALIRSPLAPIVQGTNYDTVGNYEDATNQAIGDGLGILDQLPAGADLMDSVFVVEGGGGDRDRAATTEERGYPGIHVHQPTPFTPGGNVTSDAVSRRLGQTIPNSLGAWFNGDIANGDPSAGPIQYLEDSFFVSVTAPDGAVITPGAPNVLRTVYFRVSDQNLEVAEAAGSVTVRIERTGNLNEVIDVTYKTTDIGSAQENVDYTGGQQVVQFGVGEAFKDVTIPILADSEAEGFERFRVDIVSVSNPAYLIRNGKVSIGTDSPVNNGQAVVTIVDANVLTKTFQNGVDGYMGTSDAYLDGEFIFDKFGQDPIIRVDQVKGEGEGQSGVVRPQQGLIRFDDMFGAAMNQVPLGSTIFDAFLTVNVTNVASGADIRFFRMLQDWEQVNATWVNPQGGAGFSIQNGVTPDNVEATAAPDARVPAALTGQAGLVQIPLNVDTIQAWANGSLSNFGWSIVSDLGSLWSFNSSEAFLTGTFKPELTILYTDPVATDKGAFGFSLDSYVVNENATATITVNRVGGSNGAAAVNWEITPGTGTLADITGPASGVLNFAAGELFKTFNIPINNDIELEPNETLNVTLSGAGLEFDRASALLTIRDNDFNPASGSLLLNEIWINSPGNDPPHEFVELTGTAGIGMGSLYYVAIEGLVGDREGTAEKVVDIGSYFNGANGHTVITPTAADFAFNLPAGATQIDKLDSIGQENVASQNDSTTYLLLYSPFTVLTETAFDYDWDNDGNLELPLGVQIVDSVSISTAGAEDQLYGPNTNEIPFTTIDPDVDAISRLRGNTQVNRGTAWYGGDLFPAGDDYLLYETAEAFFLPVSGTAMSPGEANTGTPVQSPLVALTGVTPNPNGTVSVTFNGPISQVLSGDGGTVSPGGSGITLTDANGAVISTIDARPVVTGFYSNTLTLSFTGPAVVGGQLPAGTYQLNFVGNGIIANGRAVDVQNNGTQINSFREFEFTVGAPTSNADFNSDGAVDGSDFLAWQRGIGTPAAQRADGDANNDATVDGSDLAIWRDQFGGAPLAPAATTSAAANLEASLGANTWFWLANSDLAYSESEVDALFESIPVELPTASVLPPASPAARLMTASAESWLTGEDEQLDADAADEAFAELDELLAAAF
jgi:hypothetical protein